MYNPFDLESTDNNDNRSNHASLTGTHSNFVQHPPLPTFLPHVFPHPHPESFTSQSGSSSFPPTNHQIYPFSPPATVHKGTAAKGRRGRIVSRDLYLQSQPYPSSSQAGSQQQSGSWNQLDDGRQNDSGWVLGNLEDGQGGDVPRTVGRRRVGRGRGRAVDCITGLPTPPHTKDTRLDLSSHPMHHQHHHHPPMGALPPTPASTVRTKRMVDYRSISGTKLDIPDLVLEEEVEGDEQEVRLGSIQAPSGENGTGAFLPGRTSRMFARQIGPDGSWQVELPGHQTGSGLAGRKRRKVVDGSVWVVGASDVSQNERAGHMLDEEDEGLGDTDREGTPEGKAGSLRSSVLLSAAPIPGMRKGNSFLQQLEAVAAEKKREEEEHQQQQHQQQRERLGKMSVNPFSARKMGTSLFGGDAGRNPFDDDDDATVPVIKRPTGMKGRLLSFGESRLQSSDEEDSDHEDRQNMGRRLPSPAGMINFKSTKPSLSRSGSAVLDVPEFALKPPAGLGNPFDDLTPVTSRQPEAGPSSPISTLMAGGPRGKKSWTRPVSGGEDDPFAEKPGDLERMLERQRQFVRRPERPVMEFTFRGHKTSAPNPLYGLDETPFMARLPPSHPEFSPAPIPRPKFLLDKFMAQAERAKRGSSAGSSSDETPSPPLGAMSITPDGFVAQGASSTSKRDTQSILGKRSRSDQERDEEEQTTRPRSVSEQVGVSPGPRTPARKRIRSSMHPVGIVEEHRGSSTTPRSTVRKTGLHRL